jgi:hypothetical protein
MLFYIDFIIANFTLKPFFESLLTALRVFWYKLLLFISNVLPPMYYEHDNVNKFATAGNR